MLSEIYDGMNSERLANKQKNHRRKEERYGKLQFKKKKKEPAEDQDAGTE